MALYTIRSGVNNHPEKSVLQFTTDLIRRGGVISGFTTTETAGGATMAVSVSSGDLYAKNSAEAYPVNNDGIVTVSVPLNSSANDQIDTLICYVDLEVVPTASGAGTGIAKFVVIPGTPATTPQPPTDSDITSIIGVNTPFERIAQIAVASEATAINNEDITDVKRLPYLKSIRQVETMTASGTLTLDASETDTFEVTMSGNITLATPSNMDIGDWIYLTLIQDATGGRTFTYTGFSPMSADMSLSSGANQVSNFAIQKTFSGYRIYAAGRQYA